jgi:hypothetical protein
MPRSLAPSHAHAAIVAPSCTVCGSAEIAVDEVRERRGLWRLSECRRCAHQWTDGPFGGPRGPVARVLTLPLESHAEAA